jgi:hypothetical protein
MYFTQDPKIQQVEHLVTEDRPHAVAYLLSRRWRVLKILNTKPHQNPRYVFGWIKQQCESSQKNPLLDVERANFEAIRAHKLRIRIRRCFRELLLRVASQPLDRRPLLLYAKFCKVLSRLEKFLRFSCRQSDTQNCFASSIENSMKTRTKTDYKTDLKL